MSQLISTFSNNNIEAGCDEAGRGCLAGAVFASSVILPLDFFHPLLNDSKQLTEKNREKLRPIIEKEAIAWNVCQSDVATIDKINILNASFQAMHSAILGLKVNPELLLIDGNYFPPLFGYTHHCIVKGDGKYTSIAAASILAKTHRDEYMRTLDKQYPEYNFKQHKGYATKGHRSAILKYGMTPYHRQSFHCKNKDLP